MRENTDQKSSEKGHAVNANILEQNDSVVTGTFIYGDGSSNIE